MQYNQEFQHFIFFHSTSLIEDGSWFTVKPTNFAHLIITFWFANSNGPTFLTTCSPRNEVLGPLLVTRIPFRTSFVLEGRQGDGARSPHKAMLTPGACDFIIVNVQGGGRQATRSALSAGIQFGGVFAAFFCAGGGYSGVMSLMALQSAESARRFHRPRRRCRCGDEGGGQAGYRRCLRRMHDPVWPAARPRGALPGCRNGPD